MKHKNLQFAVIGLGRFGTSMTIELSRMGYDVLAIDNNEDIIHGIADIATHAVEADAMDEEALKSLGVRNFDVVIVSIGENIQANILATIILKEMGVKRVVAKAQNSLHGKVLEKLGAEVIFPERDMAVKVARSLVSENILDQIELSPEYGIMELMTPKSFVNQNLAEVDLRKKTGATILAIKHGEEIIVAPRATQAISAGDILVALGKYEHLHRLSEID
ncbi:MAG TPA: TrkA family potassium uptake protein [Desulfotomaculum sp.]|nr:MAG: potassium uptake system protein [Desulfotomaculum sp. BICA1-6]HBX22034.1 TrkA family potassium uptake protein [Desulfotomaculum sp.]